MPSCVLLGLLTDGSAPQDRMIFPASGLATSGTFCLCTRGPVLRRHAALPPTRHPALQRVLWWPRRRHSKLHLRSSPNMRGLPCHTRGAAARLFRQELALGHYATMQVHLQSRHMHVPKRLQDARLTLDIPAICASLIQIPCQPIPIGRICVPDG